MSKINTTTPTAITLGKKRVYCSPESGKLRIGSKGRMLPAGSLFRDLGRGTARQLRKQLREAGLCQLAGVPRT